jgi:hypothetical protein
MGGLAILHHGNAILADGYPLQTGGNKDMECQHNHSQAEEEQGSGFAFVDGRLLEDEESAYPLQQSEGQEKILGEVKLRPTGFFHLMRWFI